MYKTMAHINSLNGKMDEITVLAQISNNDYIVDYKGVNVMPFLISLLANFTQMMYIGGLIKMVTIKDL